MLHNDSVDPILEKQRKEERRQGRSSGGTGAAARDLDLELGAVRGGISQGVRSFGRDSKQRLAPPSGTREGDRVGLLSHLDDLDEGSSGGGDIEQEPLARGRAGQQRPLDQGGAGAPLSSSYAPPRGNALAGGSRGVGARDMFVLGDEDDELLPVSVAPKGTALLPAPTPAPVAAVVAGRGERPVRDLAPQSLSACGGRPTPLSVPSPSAVLSSGPDGQASSMQQQQQQQTRYAGHSPRISGDAGSASATAIGRQSSPVPPSPFSTAEAGAGTVSPMSSIDLLSDGDPLLPVSHGAGGPSATGGGWGDFGMGSGKSQQW